MGYVESELNSNIEKIKKTRSLIINGGGHVVTLEVDNFALVGIDGQSLIYQINANTVIGEIPFPIYRERILYATDINLKCYPIRILTTGQLHSMYAIPVGSIINVCAVLTKDA